jgi:ketosteroid isomerase-like protein
MSQENVEVMRRNFGVFNAFMRSELTTAEFGESFDPGIEVLWQDRRTYPDFPQRLRGRTELMEFSEQFRGEWTDLIQEPLDLIEAPGERVLALVRQSGQGRRSGVPIVIHFYEVLTVRDGRVRRIEYFRHRADAEAAAGLSE